ncbi:MAG: cohesin domain-containing protein [Planctomycetota bacterium]|jgi:hypothetical protein
MQRSKTTPLRSIGFWLAVTVSAAVGAAFTGCATTAQDKGMAWAEAEPPADRGPRRSTDRSVRKSGPGSKSEGWGWGEEGSSEGSEGHSGEWAAEPSEREIKQGKTLPEPRKQEVPPTKTARAETARVDPAIVTVRVDVGDRRLAAYELSLRYDPEALSVTRVYPPHRGGFPASAKADPSTFQSGTTPLIGFHIGGPFPTGTVVVAVVRFKAKRPGNHAVSVSVKSLYSPDDKPIPGTARVSPQSVRSR